MNIIYNSELIELPDPDSATHNIIGWGCPLQEPISQIGATLGFQIVQSLNYFFPIAEFGLILGPYLVAIAMYYVASIAMRWAKAIG